jgi:hypothetical protein
VSDSRKLKAVQTWRVSHKLTECRRYECCEGHSKDRNYWRRPILQKQERQYVPLCHNQGIPVRQSIFEQAPSFNQHNNTDNSNARRTGVVKKINEPCKTFSTTGIPLLIQPTTTRFVHSRGWAIWVAANVYFFARFLS